MLMRQIYDEELAQAAYLIGCPAAQAAIMIDPLRDVDRYLALAASLGVRITAVAETHIHADFLSGTRELAEQGGDVEVLVSGAGGAEWRPNWLHQRSGGAAYRHRLLQDGDTFEIGSVRFQVLHTPGHTPEHVSFLVSDGSRADQPPVGVATGDFVFVGDLGRPDLLESALGQKAATEAGVRALRESARKLLQFPDFVQVWPGHGAGSACGKSLGAVPQSTVGFERRYSPPLQTLDDAEQFARQVGIEQPDVPGYFARMKRQNQAGPPVLHGLPKPRRLGAADAPQAGDEVTILDARPWAAFKAGHLPGALHTPPDNSFSALAASYADPAASLVLVVEAEGQVEGLVRRLVRVGLDRIDGYLTAHDLPAKALQTAPEVDIPTLRERMKADDITVLDVRRSDEFAAGHFPGALHIMHLQLAQRLDEVPRDKPVLVSCRSGGRSARAMSLLRRTGFEAMNVAGGALAWQAAGHELVR